MVVLAIALGSTGCTTVSLERYTLNQVHTSGECRDSTVLNCLAAVAADPDTVPSFALYGDGVTTVQDTIGLSSTTSWTRMVNSFALETLGVMVSRSPKGQWTITPTLEHERLEALHAACLWAICGPEKAIADHPGILGEHQQYLDQKPHFGVEDRLAKLPKGWVHAGCLTDVPPCALFKGHAGKTWVWVMPEDAESFAQLTLALHDIATLDFSSIVVPPLVVTLTKYGVTKLPDVLGGGKGFEAISYNEFRVVKPQFKTLIEERIRDGMAKTGKVNLTWAEWIEYTDPFIGVRPAGTPATATPTPQTASQLSISPGAPARSLRTPAIPLNLAPR